MQEKRYQIIKKLIDSANDITISVQLDKQYSHIVKINAYTSPLYANNKNLEFVTPLRINHTEHFPSGFDSALLFPLVSNEEFSELEEEANSSTFEVTVKDSSFVAGTTTPYYIVFIATLVKK